jgi:hypothetical protein
MHGLSAAATEVFRAEERVHIIDFDTNQGSQTFHQVHYIKFILKVFPIQKYIIKVT